METYWRLRSGPEVEQVRAGGVVHDTVAILWLQGPISTVKDTACPKVFAYNGS
jgi:hypothetical protein